RSGGDLFARPVAGAVPRGVLRAVRRGLQLDPGKRYDSLPSLLKDLRSHRRHRSQAAAAGVMVSALVAMTVIAYRVDQDRQLRACSQGMQQVWNQGQRERIEAAFRASSAPEALMRWITARQRADEFSARWSRERLAACVAAASEKTNSAALRLQCLD